eukprot:2387462-Rhodomonas_salina.1
MQRTTDLETAWERRIWVQFGRVGVWAPGRVEFRVSGLGFRALMTQHKPWFAVRDLELYLSFAVFVQEFEILSHDGLRQLNRRVVPLDPDKTIFPRHFLLDFGETGAYGLTRQRDSAPCGDPAPTKRV